uniref:Uncharacterized protein n=1 Tax=Physcomitrium patens TaxID=3218 RepID=A9TPK7_PHYPA|nr:hypothetical protein PHYPA_002876 [Physcomitrium patens]
MPPPNQARQTWKRCFIFKQASPTSPGRCSPTGTPWRPLHAHGFTVTISARNRQFGQSAELVYGQLQFQRAYSGGAFEMHCPEVVGPGREGFFRNYPKILITLNLPDVGINGSILTSLGNCTKLEVLDVALQRAQLATSGLTEAHDFSKNMLRGDELTWKILVALGTSSTWRS